MEQVSLSRFLGREDLVSTSRAVKRLPSFVSVRFLLQIVALYGTNCSFIALRRSLRRKFVVGSQSSRTTGGFRAAFLDSF